MAEVHKFWWQSIKTDIPPSILCLQSNFYLEELFRLPPIVQGLVQVIYFSMCPLLLIIPIKHQKAAMVSPHSLSFCRLNNPDSFSLSFWIAGLVMLRQLHWRAGMYNRLKCSNEDSCAYCKSWWPCSSSATYLDSVYSWIFVKASYRIRHFLYFILFPLFFHTLKQ